MQKYIGKYRTCCSWDRGTLEPIKHDLFIQCYREGQIYRINKNILAYYRPLRGYVNQMIEKLDGLGVRDITDYSTDGDTLIHFNEEDLELAMQVFEPVTSGANISPWSVKNLRKLKWFKDNIDFYKEKGLYKEASKELTEEEKEVLRERLRKGREKINS